MAAVKTTAELNAINHLPPAFWPAAYIAAMLVSAVYFGWLAWRLKKGAAAGLVFWRAVAWVCGTVLLAASILPVLWVVDFLAFQIWLAGLFLIPGFFKRFRWLVNDLLGGAPERWKNSVVAHAKARYRASRFHAWQNGWQSWWDGMPEQQRRLVDLAIGTAILIYIIYL